MRIKLFDPAKHVKLRLDGIGHLQEAISKKVGATASVDHFENN